MPHWWLIIVKIYFPFGFLLDIDMQPSLKQHLFIAELAPKKKAKTKK